MALVGAGGCEGVTPENLDRWRSTVKGPEKLVAALRDSELDPGLRAHAAHNLVIMDRFSDVRGAFEAMPESRRHAVVAPLVPRLWQDARIAGELDQPTTLQRGAKDALFELREFADPTVREQIDEHLVDWLAGGYYEGRAQSGRVSGRVIVRAIGPSAGPKLLEAARRVVARPPDAEGKRARIGDELLRGLALSAHPEAVGFAIELVGSDRRDETLPRRAMAALHQAYVAPVGVEPADPAVLKRHVPALVAISRDESLEGAAINDSLDLIAAAGLPECLEPFVQMVSFPHTAAAFRWIGIQKGMRCGGMDAIVPLAEALPPGGSYERGILERYFWEEVDSIPARRAVAERALSLLGSENWVARATGIELVKRVATPGEAALHAKKIRGLASDSTVLRGWLGEHPDPPRGQRRSDPTLGQLAVDVAKHLEGLAREGAPK